MGQITVEGTYRDGKVELDERPKGVGASARVLVTFVPAPAVRPEDLPHAEGEARERLLARMEAGLHLGGSPYPGREEIYDERINRRR